MPIRRVALAVVILCLAPAWAADIPGYAPAPPDLVAGILLTDHSQNFTIPAPNTDWVWLTKTTPVVHAYLCRNTKTDLRYVMTVTSRFQSEVPPAMLAGVIKSIKTQHEKLGWKVGEVQQERTTIPIPGSYRFYAKAERGKQKAQIVGYIGAAGHVYTIQTFLPGDQDPAEFAEFVHKFALLKPVAAPLTKDELRLSGFYILAAVFFIGGSAIVNKVVGRPIVNGGLFSLGFCWLALVVRWIWLTRQSAIERTRDMLPEQLGRALGLVLIPIIISIVFMVLFIRKQHRQRAEFRRT